MNQFIEFMGNHPLLFMALGGVLVWMIVSEVKRSVVGAKPLSPKQAVQLINGENAILIDTRNIADYKKGHIIDAKNIPLSNITNVIDDMNLDKDKPVMAYCESGHKAPSACEILKKHGFEKLYYLKPGIYGWLNENLPVEN